MNIHLATAAFTLAMLGAAPGFAADKVNWAPCETGNDTWRQAPGEPVGTKVHPDAS